MGGDGLCEDVGEDGEEGALDCRREEGGEVTRTRSRHGRSWSWSFGHVERVVGR